MPSSTAAPDLILLAPRCYSAAGRIRPCHALAIRGGRIVAAGTKRSVVRLRGQRTRMIDLGETGAVTPGLIDAHTHFYYWALGRALTIDVSADRTLDATLARIGRESRTKSVGEWVVARGFDCNDWPGGWPNAADLDRIVPGRPVMVRSKDGHVAWLNSAGMQRIGLRATTADPPGGRYLRRESGEPSGIVMESAVDLLPNPLADLGLSTRPRDRAQVDRAMQAGYAEARRLGLTGVHALDDAPSLRTFQRHRGTGALGLRITHSIPLAQLGAVGRLGMSSDLGDEWLRVAAIKIFADGTLGSQTALMFDPYPEALAAGRTDHGVAVVAGEELRATVAQAASQGWACWIHAIGDRAVSEAIDALAAARRVEPRPLFHRIEHTQCIRPADVRRMARARIAASVQPCHILGDIRTADRHWPRARRNAYPFRRLLDAGICLPLGSDAPVESIDPRRSFFAAVCRTDEAGAPRGGWFADQKLTAAEVLRGFTAAPAESIGTTNPAAALVPGAVADLTLWYDDPLRCRPEALRECRITGVVLDGRAYVD